MITIIFITFSYDDMSIRVTRYGTLSVHAYSKSRRKGEKKGKKMSVQLRSTNHI